MVSIVNLLTHASILPISLLFEYFAIHSRRSESIFTAVRDSNDKNYIITEYTTNTEYKTNNKCGMNH